MLYPFDQVCPVQCLTQNEPLTSRNFTAYFFQDVFLIRGRLRYNSDLEFPNGFRDPENLTDRISILFVKIWIVPFVPVHKFPKAYYSFGIIVPHAVCLADRFIRIKEPDIPPAIQVEVVMTLESEQTLS